MSNVVTFYFVLFSTSSSTTSYCFVNDNMKIDEHEPLVAISHTYGCVVHHIFLVNFPSCNALSLTLMLEIEYAVVFDQKRGCVIDETKKPNVFYQRHHRLSNVFNNLWTSALSAFPIPPSMFRFFFCSWKIDAIDSKNVTCDLIWRRRPKGIRKFIFIKFYCLQTDIWILASRILPHWSVAINICIMGIKKIY